MTSKERLLKIIAKYEGERRRAKTLRNIKSIKAELSQVRQWKAAAEKRLSFYERTGETISADRSRQAADYAAHYESQLEHILEGYKATLAGKIHTKDAAPGRRFRDRPQT